MGERRLKCSGVGEDSIQTNKKIAYRDVFFKLFFIQWLRAMHKLIKISRCSFPAFYWICII